MSNLPCEILDHIVDLLHDSQTPLRNCCLVSKPWVARTRRHLFAEVEFQTAESPSEKYRVRFRTTGALRSFTVGSTRFQAILSDSMRFR